MSAHPATEAERPVDQAPPIAPDLSDGLGATGAALCPNRADMERHLYALFEPTFVHPHPDAWIEIAYGYAATGGAPNAAERFSVFDLEEAADFAEKKNKAGFNIYVGAALRQGETGDESNGRASGENFLAASHAWSDSDNEGDAERVHKVLKDKNIDPAMVVETGRTPHLRFHVYVKLDGKGTADDIRDANGALKALFGGDKVQNPDRVMRLAGTINYPTRDKPERGYVTELVTLRIKKDAPTYTVEQLTGGAPRQQGGGRKKAPSEENPASTTESFFKSVNALALVNLKWVKVLFGDKVRLYPSGEWRITSKDLGRNLEEDLSISQRGVWDYGLEKGRSPIDLVVGYGPRKSLFDQPVQPTAADAALWLCEQMGVPPEALGWNKDDDGGAKGEQNNSTGGSQHAGQQRQTNDNADDDKHRPPAFTEEALALKFAALHEEGLRYVAPWGRWMIWDGTRWLFDETLRGFDLARKLCRQASAECNKSKAANVLASAKTVAAVERLAKTDRRLAATTDQWDANPWLLNTPDGVIDLKTGEQRPHRPEDYLTRITAVGAGGECPTWKAFLNRVTGGDTELQSFLQRMSGLALTGDTSAHALFFMHGSGANGKSVFLSTVSGIALEYHKTAPIETFTASSIDRHPTDLAGLRGARMVTAIETEEGRRWAESRIKALTGGDKISARFMRQDFFEFTPQFKLIIAGNHKPGLRSVDEAIRRRFHLIPFTVTIPPAERDLTLADRLKAEWPGILAWMIQGCLDWQRQGLAPPEAVTSATAEYMSSEDALATWMEEACVLKADASALASDLFASWRVWAEAAGESAGSQKKFSQALENRPGISKQHTNRGALFHGLRPRSLQ